MQRDLLLISEMIAAAERAQSLVAGVDLDALGDDRQRRDALLWNFTVLGEAAAQVDVDVKARFPHLEWQQPTRLRNRIVHGYWSIDLEILHTTATDLLSAFVTQLSPSTGEILSRHRTRQAALDTWRTQFTGAPVQVWRRTVPKGETLIVEGTWHESHRPG